MASNPASARILIVDDEASIRDGLADLFAQEDWVVATAADAETALSTLGKGDFDLALLDIRLPGMDGLELHRRIKSRDAHVTVIFMTAHASVETALAAMKEGAYDYITKPFQPDELTELVRTALENRRENSPPSPKPHGLVAESRLMKDLMILVETVAASEAPVLLLGESGTGKEVIARHIHARSRRRLFPFVAVNCGAIPESLLESELFGHEKGAFTGAQFRRKGRIELAAGGTLFLDEVGEIPLAMQVAFLRSVETGEVTRLGAERSMKVDFRLVSATNRPLADDVRAGRFREDLFYRLNVVTIRLPPLRDRLEEIPSLARHFLEDAGRRAGKPIESIDDEALAILGRHAWPGNVRELKNVIERAVILCRSERITRTDIVIDALATGRPDPAATGSLEDVEARRIRQALEETGGHLTRTARILGIDRTTLYRKLRRMGLKPGEDGD